MGRTVLARYGSNDGKAALAEALRKWKWQWGDPGNARLSALTTRDLGELLDAVFEEIAKGVRKNRRFAYPGFGVFTVRVRKARMGVNPQTRRPIKIPACKFVGFKASKPLNRAL